MQIADEWPRLTQHKLFCYNLNILLTVEIFDNRYVVKNILYCIGVGDSELAFN